MYPVRIGDRDEHFSLKIHFVDTGTKMNIVVKYRDQNAFNLQTVEQFMPKALFFESFILKDLLDKQH